MRAKSLKIINKTSTLIVDQQQQLSYQLRPANTTRSGVIWESSNPAIASVDKFGQITAHKLGQVN